MGAFDLNDILDWARGGVGSMLQSDRMDNLLENITTIFMFSQLTQAFGVGEGEKEYAQQIEGSVISELDKTILTLGELFNSYKEQYTDPNTISRTAQLVYERSMARIRTEADALKNKELYTLASMGLGASETGAAMNKINRMVLEQAAKAKIESEVYNDTLRARAEENMLKISEIKRGILSDKAALAEIHYNMAMKDEEYIANIVGSLVSQFYQKAPITNISNVSGTTTMAPNSAGGTILSGGADVGGAISDYGGGWGGAGGTAGSGVGGKPTTGVDYDGSTVNGTARAISKPVDQVVIDTQGRVSVGTAEPSIQNNAGQTNLNQTGQTSTGLQNAPQMNTTPVSTNIANALTSGQQTTPSRPKTVYKFNPNTGMYERSYA